MQAFIEKRAPDLKRSEILNCEVGDVKAHLYFRV
jgi:hypothetical protein